MTHLEMTVKFASAMVSNINPQSIAKKYDYMYTVIKVANDFATETWRQEQNRWCLDQDQINKNKEELV